MIFDQLRHANNYFALGERVQKALEYLVNTDFNKIEPGKYEIDGDEIYAVISQYDTKPLTSGKWEAHKKYIDIQYMVSAKEKMGFTDSQKVIVLQEYRQGNDITIYKGEGNFLIAEEGHFAIFYPTDIHMPQLALNIPKEVKKVVVKVRTDFVEASKDSIDADANAEETSSEIEE